MGCFSLQWIEQLLIWLVIMVAVFAIINLLIPYVLRHAGGVLGEGVTIVVAALRIVFWAVVVIVVIIICFDLISCLVGHGGLSLPRTTR
jgi:hypothetical protein